MIVCYHSTSLVVYGFSQEALTAVEQDAEYAVPLGYWKGAEVVGLDFTLDVSSTDGTASMFMTSFNTV